MAVPIRVLVVEDSEPDTLLMMRSLRSADFDPKYERVETREAMRAALESDRWDVIIADFSLPHFSGPEALRVLRESEKDIPFILVSGTVPEQVAIDMMRSGAQDFVLKHDLARLGPAVARELRASSIRQESRQSARALLDEQQHRLEFYRRTIEAATDGKLVICDRQEIERVAGPEIASWSVENSEQLAAVRHEIGAAAGAEGMDSANVGKFLVCVGEAMTNAIKHADGGEVSLHHPDDALICVVKDKGPGIEAMNIPSVALTRGYSTVGTLGMGYKMMIAFADKVYLATGPEGVEVAIEMKLTPTETTEVTPTERVAWVTADQSA